MAERFGTRGGVVRPNRTGTVSVGGSVGVPSAGGGTATAWGMLARNAEGLAEQVHQIHDRQVAVKSAEEGTLDAISGRVRRLDRSTTRGGAYMDAALETSGLIASTNALVAMADFYQQYPNDPASLEQAISDYADGAAGEIMGVDPASAVQLRAKIITHGLPMINAAVENRERTTAVAKKAAQEQAEGLLQTTIARNAAGVFDDDEENRRSSSSALFDALGTVQSLQSEDAATSYLLSRLPAGKDAAHIVNMKAELKTRLSAMIEAAPDDVKAGLQIFSGYRSIERQRQLFEASDKSGRMVAPPGRSLHNHGQAADLQYNGKAFADAPESVRKWVHDHAGEFGLKFPMDYEPWHIEIQETRGGEPFDASTIFGGQAPNQQEIIDGVTVPAFRSWFSRQTDKAKAYLDFVEGKTELPMYMPGQGDVTVNVRRSLSDNAAVALQNDLFAQISQEHALRERVEKAGAEEAAKRSNETRLGFMTGLLADGQEMRVGDRVVRAVRPTEGDVLDAVNRGELETDDAEDLLKALRSPPAVTSDAEVERGLFQMIARGDDPTDFIMANISSLTADDAKKWLDYWGTKQNADGALNQSQRDYLELTEKVFIKGPFDIADDVRQEKMRAAVHEARGRMLAGEKPEDVFLDIERRSKYVVPGMSFDPLTPAVIRPRFSVPDPANPQFIDPAATSAAILKARETGVITEAQYRAAAEQFEAFVLWQQKQQAAAAAPK